MNYLVDDCSPVCRIDIVGPLGVGKTTLLNYFSEHYECDYISLIYEDLSKIKNEIEYWNKNKQSRTYFMQSVYYFEAFNQLKNLEEYFKVMVSDFSILFHHYGYTYYLYKQGLLNTLELKHLESIYENLVSQAPRLAGLIYCYASCDSILSRVLSRNRQLERTTTKHMIESLLANADELIQTFDFDVLNINLDKINLPDAASKMNCYLQKIKTND